MTINRNWYVVYTKPNMEKKFADQITRLTFGCEVYLPLLTEQKQWSDRVKSVSRPLFKSYVFVYADESEYHHIKRINGFVEYIRFNGKPSIIRTTEIDKIKNIIASGFPCEPAINQFTVGQTVEIHTGSLRGYRGKLVEIKNNTLFAIEVQGLDQSLLMSVPVSMLNKTEEA
ncbi:UpxY family transcription antiterminator [Pseudoalteromonas luteoviolacea]|uniref:UpxY family transcription antiterminator n=1 Tax=Pseudoalteromonas luteoviolacea TaxID=43657 RepID=UPI00114E2D8B|nr:UpxY family transcription antiterminator [Pseudoalteromonas luteoviolacea]TQF70974.1 UpxY family transcription antiterminator [Pseudoalteromonas luteoviolacea]